MEDDTQKFREQLRDFSTAMLITKTDDGEMRARPMAIAEIEESGCISFLTAKDTAKVH